MKTLIALLIIFCSFTARTQELRIKQNLEQTYYSPKLGTYVGIELENGSEAGGFYQSSSMFIKQSDDLELPERFEREYFGAYISYPLWMTGIAAFKLNVRAGMLNNEKMLVTPSLLAEYNIVRVLRLGFGAGVRVGQPAFHTSIAFKIM